MATCFTHSGLALGLCAGLVLFAGGCGPTGPAAENTAGNTTEDNGKGKAQPSEKTNPVATTITIPDMDCEVCAGKLVKKLTAVAGVAKVEADVKAQTLTITPKEKETPSPKALWETCVAACYDPTKLEGPSGVFTSTPTPWPRPPLGIERIRTSGDRVGAFWSPTVSKTGYCSALRRCHLEGVAGSQLLLPDFLFQHSLQLTLRFLLIVARFALRG